MASSGPAAPAAPIAPAPRVPRRPPARTSAVLEAVRTFGRVLAANPLSFVGFVIVLLMAGAAVIVQFDPRLIVPYGAEQFTGAYHQPPSLAHPFGTDELGFDTFSNVLLALPTDLGIGFAIAGIALLVGGTLGLVAGFWDRPRSLGGAVSVSILRLTDIFLSFPSLVLALAITAALGRGVDQAILAIVATWWPYYVRLVRGEVLAVKHQPYITAARAAGVGEVRILFRHVLRNILDPIVVYFTLDIGTVLVTFSTIAFVAKPIVYPGPTPEWGSMIYFYQDYANLYPWLIVFPGLAVFVAVFAFSLLGDGLRDVLDPRSRRAFVRTPAVAPPPPPVPLAGAPSLEPAPREAT